MPIDYSEAHKQFVGMLDDNGKIIEGERWDIACAASNKIQHDYFKQFQDTGVFDRQELVRRVRTAMLAAVAEYDASRG